MSQTWGAGGGREAREPLFESDHLGAFERSEEMSLTAKVAEERE